MKYTLLLGSLLLLAACDSDRGGGGNPPPPGSNDSGVPAGADTGMPPADAGMGGADSGAGMDAAGGMDATMTSTDFNCDFPLATPSPAVPYNQMASAAPAATGGPVVAGTYGLRSVTSYTGAGGASGPLPFTLRGALFLSATQLKITLTSQSPVTAVGNYTTNGSTMMVQEVCNQGAMNNSMFDFSSDGIMLKLYSQALTGGTQEMVFEHQ